MKSNRRTFISGLGAAVTLAPGFSLRAGTSSNALTQVDHQYLPTAKQIHDWHAAKDSKGGPTLAGSPSWHNYLDLLEKELRACGVVDIFHNPIPYTRWHTTEFPDDSAWTLHVDGKKIKVASYGANSGKTPDTGVTGQLVLYKRGMSADELRGKIAIVVKSHADSTTAPTDDYEYLSDPETFKNPLIPRSEEAGISPFPIMGLGPAQQPLIAAGAAGAVIVMPLSFEALSGVYTFGVPALHQMPSLYLDKETGAQIVAAAGRSATLLLISETEPAEPYQFFGYLPGKDYGTPADQQVLLITHTDGPSISQENGGLGILSMVRYFSRVPQSQRPRTLMIFYDCRHYMPGAERAFAAQDYAASHPELYKKVIAAMGIEHLGQVEVSEEGKPYHRTGRVEMSSVWITNNQHLVDIAIKAVKDNRLKRVQVQCPGRKGIHGGEQGPWYGLGGIARRIGIPGASTMGSMSAYWSSKARMDYLDVPHFLNQMATMCQICGELMTADVESIKTAGGRGAA